MGLVTRFGKWIDTRFPEKVPVEAVMGEFLTLRAAVNQLSDSLKEHLDRIVVLEKSDQIQDNQLSVLKDLKDDLTKVKAIMQLKQKQMVEMPNMTGAMAWKR